MENTSPTPATVQSPTEESALWPRTFSPAGVPPPPPTYDHVAVTPLLPSSRLITLAGLTGCDPASAVNPSTLREQAVLAYAKVEICLAAAGAKPRDIVQVREGDVVPGSRAQGGARARARARGEGPRTLAARSMGCSRS